MFTPQQIKAVVAEKGAQAAIEALRPLADAATEPKEKALLEAEIGKLLWRLNRRGEAITAYETSAQLDPSGPGAVLLAHTNQIMDFFCPDLLNP